MRAAPPLLALALVALASCGPTGSSAPDGLVGVWHLDSRTREWLPRACVRLDFEDPAEAAFEVEPDGDALVVRLRTPHRTAWRGRARAQTFEARQILPTTESGRFCGRQTPVALRFREVRPGVVAGVWTTPGCDVCPDRPFGALRAPAAP